MKFIIISLSDCSCQIVNIFIPVDSRVRQVIDVHRRAMIIVTIRDAISNRVKRVGGEKGVKYVIETRKCLWNAHLFQEECLFVFNGITSNYRECQNDCSSYNAFSLINKRIAKDLTNSFVRSFFFFNSVYRERIIYICCPILFWQGENDRCVSFSLFANENERMMTNQSERKTFNFLLRLRLLFLFRSSFFLS